MEISVSYFYRLVSVRMAMREVATTCYLVRLRILPYLPMKPISYIKLSATLGFSLYGVIGSSWIIDELGRAC